MSTKSKVLKVSIAHGAAVSEAFDCRGWVGMEVICTSAGWTTADLGLKVSPNADGTFYPHFKQDSTLAALDGFTYGRSYFFPADLFPSRWVKLWSTDGATSPADVNQAPGAGLTRDFIVILKGY